MKSERVGTFRKLAGKEFQTAGATKPKERLPTDLRLCLGIFKSFSFDIYTYVVNFGCCNAITVLYMLQAALWRGGVQRVMPRHPSKHLRDSLKELGMPCY